MAHNCLEESSRNAEIEDPSIPLVTSMENKLKGLHPLSSECCIYRVPKKLHEINEAAYTPLRVSIGPFHHGRKGLEAMEDHKWRYLQNFLQSTKKGMAEFVKLIKNNEEKLRQCYAETIDFHSDKFVEIILVDAVFIIGVLLRYSLRELMDENDLIFGKSRLLSDINRDLMLLENQLPFFILEDLFKEVTLPRKYESLSMITLTHNFYKHSVELEENLRSTNFTEVKHFIDFLISCLSPSKQRTEPQRGKTVKDIHFRCMTELNEAGVKFMVCSNKKFFDIKFENGILKIPHLMVTDETESLLRNILAFEQCHYEACYITDYVAFMAGLINTRKDVELLVGKKVIGHWLGDSEDVSTLFNKLGKEITLDSKEFYFSRLQEELDDYCNSNWNKWKVHLKRDYLRTPWKVISIISGAFLIILTLIQTVCSIISVTHGN